MPNIRDRLESDDHETYLKAGKELLLLPTSEVTSMLWDISQTRTGRVQARMLNQLRKFDPELANKLALQIMSDPKSEFLGEALYSLTQTKSQAGISHASYMLLAHADAIVRLWSAIYLGACGRLGEIPVLQQA